MPSRLLLVLAFALASSGRAYAQSPASAHAPLDPAFTARLFVAQDSTSLLAAQPPKSWETGAVQGRDARQSRVGRYVIGLGVGFVLGSVLATGLMARPYSCDSGDVFQHPPWFAGAIGLSSGVITSLLGVAYYTRLYRRERAERRASLATKLGVAGLAAGGMATSLAFVAGVGAFGRSMQCRFSD